MSQPLTGKIHGRLAIPDNSNDPQALPVIDNAFHDEVLRGLERDEVPMRVRSRLQGARNGTLPWSATLTPAELLIVRSHGLRPIATVSATCWLHYGWSWTCGHSEGWGTALRRLKREAHLAGANAILDVKMRTPFATEGSMDFTLVGTAVHVAGLAPSNDPIVATVPALEFVKLLEADVVPTGIAVGADYEWLDGGLPANLPYEVRALSELWERVRTHALIKSCEGMPVHRATGYLLTSISARRSCANSIRSRHYTPRDNTLRAISWWPRLSMRAARRHCPMTSESSWICTQATRH